MWHVIEERTHISFLEIGSQNVGNKTLPKLVCSAHHIDEAPGRHRAETAWRGGVHHVLDTPAHRPKQHSKTMVVIAARRPPLNALEIIDNDWSGRVGTNTSFKVKPKAFGHQLKRPNSCFTWRVVPMYLKSSAERSNSPAKFGGTHQLKEERMMTMLIMLRCHTYGHHTHKDSDSLSTKSMKHRLLQNLRRASMARVPMPF